MVTEKAVSLKSLSLENIFEQLIFTFDHES